jgi:general secretion pathway protein G
METIVKKTVRVMMRRLFSLANAGAAKRNRQGARGVTLVEVMIVIAIMAVISGGATLLAFPLYKESRIKTAVLGCSTVKQAADLYQNLEGAADQCPTIQDLVSSKKLDSKKTDDPWNMPYKIVCTDGDIHVISAGNDRKEGTPDDVRDDFKDADVKRVKAL